MIYRNGKAQASTFDNFPSEATPYTGSDSDLQREKRMNNWIRSYSLPSLLGDAVQRTMLDNPYDRSAALRAELARSTAGATRLPWNDKENLAMQLYSADGINPQAGDGAAPGALPMTSNRHPGAMQSAGPVASRGSVNGVEMAVPTAGNYLNGAFQSHLNDLGLTSQSPSWNSYQDASYNQTTPAQRWQADQNDKLYKRAVDVANINSQGRVNAAALKGGKGSTSDALKAQQKLYQGDDKERQSYTKELYGEYKNFVKRNGNSVPFDAWAMSDPVAQTINDKYQALGQQNGRAGRENRQAQADLMAGNMTPGAKAEDLTRRTIDGPAAAPSNIKTMTIKALQEGRAKPEEIRQMAKQSKMSSADIAEVEAGIAEGERLRKVQYGSPVEHPATQAKKAAAKTSSVNASATPTAAPQVQMRPITAEEAGSLPPDAWAKPGKAGYQWFRGARDPILVDAQGNVIDPRYRPQGTSADMYRPAGTTRGQDMIYANDGAAPTPPPRPSLLDVLIQRLQGGYENPLFPSPKRYGASSPIA